MVGNFSVTPLRKWFLAFYYMSEYKRGISALALKSKISVAYQTAWSMCQKIRHAMGERDNNYKLDGIVEIDEAFFGSPQKAVNVGEVLIKPLFLCPYRLQKMEITNLRK